ncbi:hypothetical protein Q8A67_021457 [Cirrhinus molitorella]|uniref:Uncharacterized protein n=1 Tax=Cirrhinus molitorella TaxID=172907 RepID=A0AA88P3L5_9TELE|nr:hypothetical protein Q8A67_021457 [Cirrhinus molitorella]
MLKLRQRSQCSTGLEQVRLQRDESTTGPSASRSAPSSKKRRLICSRRQRETPAAREQASVGQTDTPTGRNYPTAKPIVCVSPPDERTL